MDLKPNKQAVPFLIIALKDRDKDVRSYAAIELSKIGSEATIAVPVLIQSLKDRDKIVRSRAAKAIRKINVKIEAETTDETSFDF